METISCTLTGGDLASRRERWHALAGRSLLGVEQTETGLRLAFSDGRDELAELVRLERDCCAFARWTLDGTTLHVDGDTPEAVAAVHGMFRSLR